MIWRHLLSVWSPWVDLVVEHIRTVLGSSIQHVGRGRNSLQHTYCGCDLQMGTTRTQINDAFLFQNRVKVKVVGEVSEK